MSNLISFFRTKGISLVWISAVFSPTLLLLGIAEGKTLHLAIGVALSVLVILSIIDGLNALRYRLMANFIGSALVPLVSLAAGTVFAIYRVVNQG